MNVKQTHAQEPQIEIHTGTTDPVEPEGHAGPTRPVEPEDSTEPTEPESHQETTHIEYQAPSYPHCPLNHVRLTQQQQESILRKLLIGRPLRSEENQQQKVGRTVGLGVFGADALSSTVYATQEMLQVLVLAGAAVLSLSIPIAGAISILLVIIALSYRQIIFAYPEGGGAYTVARDNLGQKTAQVAGAALLTDYVLTVAVSTSASVEQVVSVFPNMYPYRIVLCAIAIVIIMLINLRGMHSSIKYFAFPTFFFIGMTFLLLAIGAWRWTNGTLNHVTGHVLPVETLQPLTLFLILRAFSSGSTALSGLKSVSASISSFRKPRSHNAALTLLAMSVLLMLMFVGITVLAELTHAIPTSRETIISQLARTIFNQHPFFYYLMMAATTIILLQAAHSSFARFPRLAALQADDGFLPHQFSLRGHRLVFWWGIVVLALAAIILVTLFDASTTALIPLYAIGVFLSFTLSQAGMVARWKTIGRFRPGEEQKTRNSVLRYTPHWRTSLAINALGCVVTAGVTLVFMVSRFSEGAWIALVVMAVLVWLFLLIKKHYLAVAKSLSLDDYHAQHDIDPTHHTVAILVSGVHRGTLEAVRYARSMDARKIIAVHVETHPDQTLKVYERWRKWQSDIPLVVVESPYRTLLRPLVCYINMLSQEETTDLVTIIIPQFVCVRWWHHLLHNQTALMIRSAFLFDRDKVVIEVPFRLEEEE